MPRSSLFIFLYYFWMLDRFLLPNAIGLSMELSGMVSLEQVIPSLICKSPVAKPTTDPSVLKYSSSSLP